MYIWNYPRQYTECHSKDPNKGIDVIFSLLSLYTVFSKVIIDVVAFEWEKIRISIQHTRASSYIIWIKLQLRADPIEAKRAKTHFKSFPKILNDNSTSRAWKFKEIYFWTDSNHLHFYEPKQEKGVKNGQDIKKS